MRGRQLRKSGEFIMNVQSRGRNDKWRDTAEGRIPCGKSQISRKSERPTLISE